ncbi:hypothetical protein SGUI_2713 [Serinicoccus hydrothermalis]|uniref:Uncharacterized protein n=1 Tax=Serinicoccus hydrothermalis TaxID=1758689 RepID=A0A1B1NFD1_9MICO|nr:hypothetical protein [Serinicoccus hydrothermalis]ANS80109.1 hypothetical protein SGUI_2713 [Serinicoccus hydrothermalis]
MISTLSSVGLRSDHCYAAGLASIGLSFVSHFVSRGAADDSKAQADRWGLFVGEWAPTFFALGVALKLEESTTVV